MLTSVDGYVPRSAMVVVAHPDDAEFMAAGTVAKWARAGASVTYVVVTTGDKGSEDPAMTPARLAEIREAEQRAAGAILGVNAYVFMGYPDGYLEHTLGQLGIPARIGDDDRRAELHGLGHHGGGLPHAGIAQIDAHIDGGYRG